MIGAAMHTTTTYESLIRRFVNKPNENNPSKGPYVYPAARNNSLITEPLLIN